MALYEVNVPVNDDLIKLDCKLYYSPDGQTLVEKVKGEPDSNEPGTQKPTLTEPGAQNIPTAPAETGSQNSGTTTTVSDAKKSDAKKPAVPMAGDESSLARLIVADVGATLRSLLQRSLQSVVARAATKYY